MIMKQPATDQPKPNREEITDPEGKITMELNAKQRIQRDARNYLRDDMPIKRSSL